MLDLEQRLDQTRQVGDARAGRSSAWTVTSTLGSSPPRGERRRNHPGLGPGRQPRTSPSTRTGTAGCSWATCCPPPSTRAARSADLGDSPGVERFDSVHSDGAPGFIVNEVNLTLTAGAGAQRARDGQRELHPAQWLRLQPRRLHRRRPRPAGMDADRVAADVDLRRQVRLRHRHRVPRAQVPPALRHHALADRALHDRSRRSGSRCAASSATTTGSSRRRASPTARRPPSSSTSTTRSTATPARPPAAGCRCSRFPLRPRDRRLGRVRRRRTARSTAAIRSGSAGADLLGHFGPVDIKAQWLIGRGDGERAIASTIRLTARMAST